MSENQNQLDHLVQLDVAIGGGKNSFSMSRGSFTYNTKVFWKKTLKQTDRTRTDDGWLLTYCDADRSYSLSFLLTVHDDGFSLSCVEDNPVLSDGSVVNRWWISIPCKKDEHFYGCGETYSELDLRGQKVRIWVAEHQNAGRIGKKLIKEKLRGKRPFKTLPFDRYESYYAQPTFVSSRKYAVHCNVNTYSVFDFTADDHITLEFQESPELQLIRSNSFTELSEHLSAVLGRPPVLPSWVHDGAILAMQDWSFEKGVTGQKNDGCGNVDRKIAAARDAGIPVTGVWCQDWCGCRCTKFGYQVMWNWEYSQEQYADLPAHIEKWKADGVRFLGYINPFIALEKNIYKEAAEKGYCVKNAEGKDYLVTITTFPAAMIDFTNPEAYAWYKEIIKKNLIGIGMGGWMADFGEYLPVDAVLYSGQDAAELHNQWPAIWARMNREAIEECGKLGEVFFFTRAGHTGTISASTLMWTGDQHVDWSVDDGLASVIPATLSLAMSGYPMAHSDVGGYTTVMHMTRSAELLMRWAEMCAFSPLFRSHEGNQPGRDVQFSDTPELLAQFARCAGWYRNLAPYLQNLEQQAAEHGTPVMRPLFYHYDTEERAYSEKFEYLLGRDLLVAPVYIQGATTRRCWLPDDKWIHVWTGREYYGGDITVEAPMGQPPVFVRKESDLQISGLMNLLTTVRD